MPFNANRAHFEREIVGQQATEREARHSSNTILTPRDELLDPADTGPPRRPGIGVVDRIPDGLDGSLEEPHGDKAVARHVP